MLHGIYKRNSAEYERVALTVLRKKAFTHWVPCDSEATMPKGMCDLSHVKVNRVLLCGMHKPIPHKLDTDIDYGWTLGKASSNDFGGIKMEPGTFKGMQLVTDDFGTGGKHAWRRLF